MKALTGIALAAAVIVGGALTTSAEAGDRHRDGWRGDGHHHHHHKKHRRGLAIGIGEDGIYISKRKRHRHHHHHHHRRHHHD